MHKIALLTLSWLALTAQTAVDGDTFKMDGEKYRLWGINAPERGQDGYIESSAFLQILLDEGRPDCENLYDDYWGRHVAICYLDGQDIGELMVWSGYAKDYPKYSKGYYAD